MTAHTLAPLDARELDHRTGDGLTVTLYWTPTDDTLHVVAEDTRTEAVFFVPVPDGVSPRDVFLHPFAYPAAYADPS